MNNYTNWMHDYADYVRCGGKTKTFEKISINFKGAYWTADSPQLEVPLRSQSSYQ